MCFDSFVLVAERMLSRRQLIRRINRDVVRVAVVLRSTVYPTALEISLISDLADDFEAFYDIPYWVPEGFDYDYMSYWTRVRPVARAFVVAAADLDLEYQTYLAAVHMGVHATQSVIDDILLNIRDYTDRLRVISEGLLAVMGL